MFKINNEDLTIYCTRGDALSFSLYADKDGENYIFQPDDVVRFRIYGKKAAEEVLLQKDFTVGDEAREYVPIYLTGEDTRIGDIISKPTDYWYEIELNPDTDPQTIVGYDEDGAKVFKLFPEGRVIE